jgi:hypothetical protein
VRQRGHAHTRTGQHSDLGASLHQTAPQRETADLESLAERPNGEKLDQPIRARKSRPKAARQLNKRA